MDQKFTKEQLLSKWESRREVQNVIGKLTQSYLIAEEAEIYQRWWSQRDDVCLGVNTGWYNGAAAVKGYYDALGEKIKLASSLIVKAFPEKLSGRSEEETYGVGHLGVKPADTYVIEIAEDGQTAKGIWSLHGTYADMTAAGPVSYWDWGYYCVDFCREDDGWKIWHMLYLTDINTPTGEDWTKPPMAFSDEESFAPLKDFVFPSPNVPVILRENYYVGRPFSPSPRLPEPYDTFANTFSYGIGGEALC